MWKVRPVDHLLCNKRWLITCDRVRGAGRRGRSDPSRPNCKELTESHDVYVDCQDRRLTTVPASHIWSRPSTHLLLARNRIKVLREGAFFGYDSVTSLDLQQNQISFVEEGAFQGLTHLTTLLLQHNRLETLSEETLIPMPSLAYLRLYHNPWNCFCPLDSLIRTLQVPSNRNLGNHARWTGGTIVWNIKVHPATTFGFMILKCIVFFTVPGVQNPSSWEGWSWSR